MNNTENKGFEVQSNGIDIETKQNGELIEYYVETKDDANALIQLMREEL